MKITLRLLGFTKKYWVLMLFSFIFLILNTGFGLVMPKVVGQGIDTVVKSGLQTQIIIFAIIIVAASALRGFTGFANRYYRQVISQRVSYDMRNKLYNHLQHLSFNYFDKSQTGQLMSRLTVDVEAARGFLDQGFMDIIGLILQVCAISVILLMLDWQMALITLAFIPAIAWRTIVVSNKLRPIWSHVQQLIAKLGITLQESLIGIKVLKLFSLEKYEGQKFTTEAKNLYDDQITVARQMAMYMPFLGFLMTIPTALLFWYGGHQVINGDLSIGGLTQFVMYTGMLFQPIRRLGPTINQLSRTVSSSQRIFEIMDTESSLKEKPNAVEMGKVEGRVSFENVSFSYNPLGTTLRNISFKVEPGQLVALLGESGSGKSSLANLISRFYDVNGGRITIDGTDISDVTLSSLRKNVGIVQQNVYLFSASIRDNIKYGVPDATMEEIIEVSKAAHIYDFIQGLPEGYDTWVGEAGVTLSGGEKQRVAIARTLLMNPSILILDDSTSSVDAETERYIRLGIDNLIKGRTTFLITHRVTLIRNADLILVLKDGRLLEHGKHNQLMELNGSYKQLYLSQLSATEDQPESQTEEQ